MQIPEPMYATIGTAMPAGPGWIFEQKYDGMRVIAAVSGARVRLLTRNRRDKCRQFPEIADAIAALGRRARRHLVLDGEVVALVRGQPAPFQALQSRMQLKKTAVIDERIAKSPAAIVLFDLLLDGRADLLRRPLTERRAALERLLAGTTDAQLRISECSTNGPRMLAKARRRGWEGVIAKRADSVYIPGARSTAWLKLKLQHRAELVVGGYTEPRRSRPYLGALLLGYYDRRGEFCYAGHMGGGFDRVSLREMLTRLRPLERRTSPFADEVKTNERVHWVSPRAVVEVKFAEWTADGKLRQPIFLGVREDKNAREVHRERESLQEWTHMRQGMAEATGEGPPKTRQWRSPRKGHRRAYSTVTGAAGSIIRQLYDIEASGGEGMLEFGRGKPLHVSSLDKPYFPDDGVTKGDLMRYYAAVSHLLLPIIKDRPLVLKRYPDGIEGPSFFQQKPGSKVPGGVRTARVATEGGERADRIIGGDLLTLLHTVQIGAIEVHAWQARVSHIRFADMTTVDLDPGEDVPFDAVVTFAKRIKVELDRLGLSGAIKTSGSSGLHVVLPLPPKTAFEDAARIATVIAERVV